MISHVLALLCVIAPVFALILLGRALRGVGLVTEAGAADLHRVVYWVGLPAQLVVAIGSSDVRAFADPRAIVVALAAYWLAFIASWFATARLPPAERGSVLSGVVRGNGAFIGLPVILLLGSTLPASERERVTSIYLVLLGIMVPCFNIGAMIGFMLPRHGLTGAGLRRTVVESLTNPLLIGCAIGIGISLSRVPLFTTTEPVEHAAASALTMLGNAAVPLALLLVGYQLDVALMRRRVALLATTSVVKLLLVPLLTYALGRWAGLDRAALTAVVVLMAAPTAMASVPMARVLGADADLMASIVVVTTAFSLFGMLLWLAVLG
ncbi:MAG: AEC family transporter [Planctomycetes bacterium]|nr:AEC family transporter [Planctomycetota bacterium]